jgi:hypothetical protein
MYSSDPSAVAWWTSETPVETLELRFANTGTAVANLRVAVIHRARQEGEWRDEEPPSGFRPAWPSRTLG